MTETVLSAPPPNQHWGPMQGLQHAEKHACLWLCSSSAACFLAQTEPTSSGRAVLCK